MGYKDKEKQKEYARNWIKARRDAYLIDKVCAICGDTSRLEIDHIDPKTKVTHRIWSWALLRRNEELKKCQILCYACHKKKTISQTLEKSITHGNSGYDRMCRCEICKVAHSIRMKTRNRNKTASVV